MQLLKKMSVKTLLGNVLALFPEDPETKQPKLGDKMDLFQIIGIAHTTKSGESNFGPWTSFKGMFEATRLDTGEIFRSGELFLPDVATDALLPAVHKNVEDDGHGVEFAMVIGANTVADRTNPKIVKYEFTCKPLLDVAESDPLAAFKNRVPALAAPVKPAQVEQSTAESVQTDEVKPAAKTAKK
ncbi:MAG TPA: hypothetical protein VFM46_12515 [Pseudomonadales bacterium]|nr:hypothetical protein [Pseudomonadales bacterium]